MITNSSKGGQVSVDYTMLYRSKLELSDFDDSSNHWPILVSAYNASERVQSIFARANADRKHWVVHPEYNYTPQQHPDYGEVFAPRSRHEADFLSDYLSMAPVDPRCNDACIDITGFMRPHLMLLVRMMFDAGVDRFHILYTDPIRYSKEERTQFTKGPVTSVRQVAGFEGLHVPDRGKDDLLIIGTGYDDELIRRVAESKANAHKVQMFGFPSLQPDMYQQNILRASLAAESVGQSGEREHCFAPANDPFVTAAVLQDRVDRERAGGRFSNLYLSPLGTKPQVLGFALYFLTEWRDAPCSMIFPFADYYNEETTKGISRVWKFTLEKLN
jgi:hypothetical protein